MKVSDKGSTEALFLECIAKVCDVTDLISILCRFDEREWNAIRTCTMREVK